MGRKGGGRAGFVKASRAAVAEEDEHNTAAPVPHQGAPAGDVKIAADAAEAKLAAPAVSAKAAAFLKGAPAAGEGGEGDSEAAPRAKGQETRGQMLQRHKHDAKALKETAKRLGKKGKDEVARLEAEMQQRHAAELAAFDAPPAHRAAQGIALADSLYAATLSGEPRGEAGGGKKVNKAQKRREQRERADAERDARIAAEQAGMGETERQAEERELHNLLSPMGLAVRDIQPDGHCLYRSLEDQLKALPDGGAATAAAAGLGDEPLSFLTLRCAAADYMRAHADHFRHFVLEGDTAEGGVAEGDDVFEAYCTEVESTAAWGGQMEIQALSAALAAHVQVFSVGMPVLEVGEEHKGRGPTLRLCYLRHAYGLGEHYNSVAPGAEPADECAGGSEGGKQAAAEEM